MKVKDKLQRGIHVSEINAGNIWALSRGVLENTFLERERTRDRAIGIAFVCGAFVGSLFVATMLVVWP